MHYPPGRLDAKGPLALEAHSALQGDGTERLGDLDGASDAAGVQTGLRGLLNDSAHDDGQLRGAMENQDAVVGQQYRRDTGGDRGPNVGYGLIGAARPVGSDRHSCRQAEHRQRFDPAADGPMGHRVGRGVRRMSMKHTADITMVRVHSGVHGHYGTLNGRQLAFKERPVKPTDQQ